MNNVSLVGRLCADPELRFSAAGVAVCKFTLAVDRPFSKEKQADFLPCLCFKATAENTANYLTKGSKAGVTGSVQTSTWEKDGVKHYKTEILADRVEFMDSKPKGEQGEHPSVGSFGTEVDLDSDIPF
jgi:single-strand DNA-binding protein